MRDQGAAEIPDLRLHNPLLAAPWLFWPGVVLVVTVLSFNFLGDGLRDAADPYAKTS